MQFPLTQGLWVEWPIFASASSGWFQIQVSAFPLAWESRTGSNDMKFKWCVSYFQILALCFPLPVLVFQRYETQKTKLFCEKMLAKSWAADPPQVPVSGALCEPAALQSHSQTRTFAQSVPTQRPMSRICAVKNLCCQTSIASRPAGNPQYSRKWAS